MPVFDFNRLGALFHRPPKVLVDPPVGDIVPRGPIQVVEDPATFEEAVDFVAARIAPETVDDPHFHFSGGMHMRNQLRLWQKESPLHQHMVQRFGLCHADDTGALISKAANAKVNGTEYDIDVDIQRFKAHWRNAGYDPATMEPLSP